MKKNLLFLTLAAIALSMFSFSKKQNTYTNNFVEYGYDVLNENNKVERLNAVNASTNNNGANKDAGNIGTFESSKLGVQYGTNKEGETCMRFAVAIPSLNASVVFNRTLTLSDGTVSYGQIVAKTAYKSLANGDEVITPDSWNNHCLDANYKYFVAYTIAGIPESEYGAKIEVSATITAIPVQTKDSDSSEPTPNAAPKEDVVVEVYNSANIYGLEGKSPDGKDAYDNKDIVENGELKVGAKFEDPITKCAYTVVKDKDGNISLEATTASILPGTNTIQISSVFIKVGNEVIEYPVTVIGAGFTSSITGNAKGNVNEIDIPNTISSIDASSFANLNKVDVIHYEGTKAEWNAMNVASGAFHPGSSGKIIVICSDGEGTLNTKTGNLN